MAQALALGALFTVVAALIGQCLWLVRAGSPGPAPLAPPFAPPLAPPLAPSLGAREGASGG